jgi:hypothetical protein
MSREAYAFQIDCFPVSELFGRTCNDKGLVTNDLQQITRIRVGLLTLSRLKLLWIEITKLLSNCCQHFACLTTTEAMDQWSIDALFD